MPPRSILSLTETNTASVYLVTYADEDDAEHTVEVEAYWQAAERDVGISAGWCVDCDDEDLADAVSLWLTEDAADRREDALTDRHDPDGAYSWRGGL